MLPSSVKRTPDAAGDDIATFSLLSKQYQAALLADDAGNVLHSFGTNDVASPSAVLTYVGKTSADGTWLVMSIDTTSGTAIRYATATNNPAVTDYATAWATRATLTYSAYDGAF